MGAAASSSSSAAISSKKYDVFISFRGEDTRTNFTSHLHTALCQKSIRTYIDYELPKGNEISQSLVQAIQDSNVSVVVFSENYASSKWCLDELTQILRCRTDQGQVVIPVFYRVDPSDVRKQKGTYKEAFAKHERDFYHNQHKVHSWKHALFETSNLAGWDSQAYRDDSELIQNLVNNVLQKLNLRYPSVLEDLVGIDENYKCIESLLKEVPIIGIWGMGGIGKTTMARAIFAKLSSKYDSCCFLENLTEESEKRGLAYIRDKLLYELLKEDNFYNSSTSSVVGSTFVMRRISSKRVFIVLDDISETDQLEYLARECRCLGAESRVIITTRNKHVLVGRVNNIYEAKALSYCKSLQLFNLKAFHKDGSEIGYEQLSKRAVVYSKGIPLALTVLGSFLHSKTKEEWDSALMKLEKIPNEGIQKVLKLSYVGLNDEERQIFLNIACFLKGKDEKDVIALLDSFGFHAAIGLRNLVDKALITIDYTVKMHDLIQKMGKEIIREECIKEPERRSQLWDSEEIYDVLKNNRGTDKIEAIILNLSKIRDVQLSCDTFKKMINLKFLKFYSPWHKKSCTMNLPSGLESLSDKLRYFQWDNFPLKCLPSVFCTEKLVELRMRGSRIKKLWNGVQDCVNLRRINLAGSKQLKELPDFSQARNLEDVNLSSCESLCHLHPSILSLEKLLSLDLSRCIKLKKFQSEGHLKSLQRLCLARCSLKEFSFWSEEIKCLRLGGTEIEILGPSIGRLKKLRDLGLNVSRLKILPINELCRLKSLERLSLSCCGQLIDKSSLHMLFDALRSLRYLQLRGLEGCSNLSELPENICALSSLYYLGLEGSNVESLPANIKHLSNLDHLRLFNCRRLRSLPELPPFIQRVEAVNCTSLETAFPLTTSRPQRKYVLDSVFLENGLKLEEHSLCRIVKYAYFSLKGLAYHGLSSRIACNAMKIGRSQSVVCYPGRKVPKWFAFSQITEASSSVTVTLSSALNNLLGFVFCCVIPQFTLKHNCRRGLRCQCYFEDGEVVEDLSEVCMIQVELKSDHVCLWYNPTVSENILRELIRRRDDEGITYNPKLSFEFSLSTFNENGKMAKYEGLNDVLTKACGVCPIYASEYHSFLQQMELQLELGMKTKRSREIDEHSLSRMMEYANFSLKRAVYGTFERNTISYSGSRVPQWFTYRMSTTEASICIRLALDFDYILGFVFCFVIPQFTLKEMHRSYSTCLYPYEHEYWFEYEGPKGWHYSMTNLSSDNVFQWYDPLFCELILEHVRRRRVNDERTAHNSVLEFKFWLGDCLIEECGVRPIYASEYNNFLQQMELKLDLGTKTKRRRNNDQQEHHPPTKKWQESSVVQLVPMGLELSELPTKSNSSQKIDELQLRLSELQLEH